MVDLQPQLGYEADGSSLNKQWIDFELALYNIYTVQQHDVDNTMTRKFDQGKAWPLNKPGVREDEDDIQQQTPHQKTILKDWENKCIVATKQHRDFHQETLHQPQKIISLRNTGDNNTKHMVFDGEPAVKLHAKNVKVGTSANWTARQD